MEWIALIIAIWAAIRAELNRRAIVKGFTGMKGALKIMERIDDDVFDVRANVDALRRKDRPDF